MTNSKKLAIAAIAGLMAVGFASQASATANPYPQGYKGNGTAYTAEKASCKGVNGCNAASCEHAAKPKHHHRKHKKAAAPVAAKPAEKAPAAKPAEKAKH